MPVANKDISELLNIILKYVDHKYLKLMFQELTSCKAYVHNKSFAETIVKLEQEVKKQKGENNEQ